MRGPVPHFASVHLVVRRRSPMRVIGAGFGRTGTLSFKRALDDLGFGPTYHMQEVMRRPSHVDRWLRYARTGEVNWDELFAGFGSGVATQRGATLLQRLDRDPSMFPEENPSASVVLRDRSRR